MVANYREGRAVADLGGGCLQSRQAIAAQSFIQAPEGWGCISTEHAHWDDQDLSFVCAKMLPMSREAKIKQVMNQLQLIRYRCFQSGGFLRTLRTSLKSASVEGRVGSTKQGISSSYLKPSQFFLPIFLMAVFLLK